MLRNFRILECFLEWWCIPIQEDSSRHCTEIGSIDSFRLLDGLEEDLYREERLQLAMTGPPQSMGSVLEIREYIKRNKALQFSLSGFIKIFSPSIRVSNYRVRFVVNHRKARGTD